jgi:opacity protein-like surface antigen
MNVRRRPLTSGILVLVPLLLLVPTTTLAAQDADFMFRRPVVTVSAYGGWAMPGEGGDVFDDIRDQLTVDRGAFNSATWGGEVAWRATERFDVAASLEYAKASTGSEYRDWVDSNDNPIEQTTELRRTPLTLSVKAYLLERGRTISRFAWVPARWSPYVGVGGGYVWYDYVQSGDFVDFDTLEIFTDELQSEGRAPTAHVLAGVEASLSEYFLIRGEYRYSWASAKPDSRYFVGYDAIDLGGGRATLGLVVRM